MTIILLSKSSVLLDNTPPITLADHVDKYLLLENIPPITPADHVDTLPPYKEQVSLYMYIFYTYFF
jgi:hypothetical protein